MKRPTPCTPKSKWLVILCGALLMAVACSSHPSASQTGSPQTDPDAAAGAITIFCGGGAQFEVGGPDGQRVLIDVNDPEMLSRPADEKDILLTTHFHFDHYHQGFMDTFPGEILQDRQGQIDHHGLTVKGLASQHTEHAWKQTGKPTAVDNHIFLVETGGLRIAHFGDIGQKVLTAEQLKILGRVDIAITQFVNPFSQMDLENQKGYRLMDQLQPKIIIPHHGAATDDAIRLAKERWDVVCAVDNTLSLASGALPDRTIVILMGEMRDYMQKTFNLKMWP